MLIVLAVIVFLVAMFGGAIAGLDLLFLGLALFAAHFIWDFAPWGSRNA